MSRLICQRTTGWSGRDETPGRNGDLELLTAASPMVGEPRTGLHTARPGCQPADLGYPEWEYAKTRVGGFVLVRPSAEGSSPQPRSVW